MKILNVVGARPNFMKIAALVEALRRHALPQVLVHTGQHYDEKMSELFFRDLGIPEPDINLDVGSGSHAQQTAEVMRRFEPVLEAERPDVVVVVGDVNSTMACALVAVKMGVRVAHVEAGLRSFDRSMPEEINRVVTDSVADLLFASEPSGVANLRREGVPPEKVHLVGNVMIDTLLRHRERARRLPTLEDMQLLKNGRAVPYAVVTLHRPSNVDSPECLRNLLLALNDLAARLPLIFPIHPRTRQRIADHGLKPLLDKLRITEPMGYLEFLGLLSSAKLVLTDSGGIQEETTVLGVPCLTIRENTERPATVEFGTNHVVGTDPRRIVEVARRVLDGGVPQARVPELWDGHAAERIVQALLSQQAAGGESGKSPVAPSRQPGV